MEFQLFPKMLPGKGRGISKRTILFLVAALLILIAAFAAYYVISQQREEARLAAEAAAKEEELRLQALQESAYQEQLSKNVFFDGISVDGVDISGLTMDQAHAALASAEATYQVTGTLQLTYQDQSYPVDLTAVKANLNTDEVLKSAYNVARRGSYLEAAEELDHLRVNGHNFTLTVSYDYTEIGTRVAEIAALIDQAGKDASVLFTADAETGKPFTITEEKAGIIVSQQLLISDITKSIQSGNLNPIAIPYQEIAPSITAEYLASVYTLRSSAETSFKGSDSNRIYNINKGAELITGTILKPGITFSANDTLGTRTYANGWKEAGAYVSGSVDKQAGGGVCQLSSTLYNAVVKADLEIVYRRNHSMPVGYVRKGLDATINSVGNLIDFKFKNNTSADILIRAYTSGKNLIFEIYGVPFATTEYDEIRLTSEQTKTVEPVGEIVETLDPTLEPGTQEVKVARQNGSVWQSYKNYYLKDTLVKSEKLALSTYDAFAGEILVGPSLEDTSSDGSDSYEYDDSDEGNGDGEIVMNG